MSTTIPTTEPATLVAGLTWQWERSLSDYPAGTWTLTYYLTSAAHNGTITASADGTKHAVSVTPANTDSYPAGFYAWTGVVTDGSAKHEIGRGTFEIKPDPAQLGPSDGRTHARKVLDAIEAVIEGRASQDQAAYSITTGGVSRSLSRTPLPELLALRDRYRAEVRREATAELIARGLGGRRRILTRFGSS